MTIRGHVEQRTDLKTQALVVFGTLAVLVGVRLIRVQAHERVLVVGPEHVKDFPNAAHMFLAYGDHLPQVVYGWGFSPLVVALALGSLLWFLVGAVRPEASRPPRERRIAAGASLLVGVCALALFGHLFFRLQPGGAPSEGPPLLHSMLVPGLTPGVWETFEPALYGCAVAFVLSVGFTVVDRWSPVSPVAIGLFVHASLGWLFAAIAWSSFVDQAFLRGAVAVGAATSLIGGAWLVRRHRVGEVDLTGPLAICPTPASCALLPYCWAAAAGMSLHGVVLWLDTFNPALARALQNPWTIGALLLLAHAGGVALLAWHLRRVSAAPISR